LENLENLRAVDLDRPACLRIDGCDLGVEPAAAILIGVLEGGHGGDDAWVPVPPFANARSCLVRPLAARQPASASFRAV
jgi:hypothetical protein